MRQRNKFLSILNSSFYDLPSPINLSVWWNFGSMLGLCLVIQIVSGFLLTIHYVGHGDIAFDSVVHIVRNVHKGWLLRGVHANGASVAFFCMYAHIGRGIYYGSYLNNKVWNVGIVLYFLFIIEAFLGYVLPWGQISYWAATVISNFLTAIPNVGNNLVQWVWGGYTLTSLSLLRFYSLHFILPFAIVLLSMLHLLFLHETGSNNPLGISSDVISVPFHPYYTVNDIVGFVWVFIGIVGLSCFAPEMLGNGLNYYPADPINTPVHIQPEWYFLFAYTILRSIDSNVGGVVVLLMSIFSLVFLPYLHTGNYRSLCFYPFHQSLFWALVCSWLGLTWIGMRDVVSPYNEVGQFFMVAYFVLLLVPPLTLIVWDKLLGN